MSPIQVTADFIVDIDGDKWSRAHGTEHLNASEVRELIKQDMETIVVTMYSSLGYLKRFQPDQDPFAGHEQEGTEDGRAAGTA